MYAVVDANGEFKRHGRYDTGEYDSRWEAEAFRSSLPNPSDYTVQEFTDEEQASIMREWFPGANL